MNCFETVAPISVARLVLTADQRMREASDLLHASRVLSGNGDEICLSLLDQGLSKQREAFALYEFA